MEEEERRLLAQIDEVKLRLELLKLQKRDLQDEEFKSDNIHSNYRLIMASNRLPISVSKQTDGTWKFEMSSGGLVTALSGLKQEIPFIWVGWIGLHVSMEEEAFLVQHLHKEFGLYPVFLSSELVDKYYNGFCNDILWPLFHYTPLPIFQPGRDMKFDMSQWEAYKEANQLFANAVAQAYQPGDIVWIHDYHLMLAPAMLRKLIPSVTVGW